jgi:hypothetical protein
MPYTVPVSFDKFRENIEPPNYDRAAATARKDRLVSLLSDDFEILESFPTGSLPRYTGIKNYTDLDIMVALHYGKHIEGKKPSQVLQSVRDSLSEYKPMRRNGQAVTVYYNTWPEYVDIVPVSRVVENGNLLYYNVPDMNTETWIPSNPNLHDEDLTKRNKEFGQEFKRIIKMIKWWNKKHSDLLQSFHIEVMAYYSLTGTFSDYSWDVHVLFDNASKLIAAPLKHRFGYVDEYLDSKTRLEAKNRLKVAKDKSLTAWHKTYGSNSDHQGAIELWRQIFGEEFPAYG